MRCPRRWAAVLALLPLLAAAVGAAAGDGAQPAPATIELPATTAPAEAEPAPAPTPAAWAFSASTYAYILPQGGDYVNPNLTADRDWLHLEARYNYEALDTGSLWLGYNLSWGEELTLGLTPMLGGVFGHLNGVAPGYLVSAGYGGLALSGQGEYVFDTGMGSGSFFYSWTELSYAPIDWGRIGVVIQRTNAYHSDLDVQRGLLVGFSHGPLQLTTYVFDIGQADPTVVLGLVASF